MRGFISRVISRRALVAVMAAGCTAIALAATGANAQTDPRVAAAKTKGKIAWYTSVAPDELRKELIEGFKKKTGLDINPYYGGTGQVFSRLKTERETGSFNADLVTLGDVDLVEQLIAANALRPFQPKGMDSIGQEYADPKGYWYGITFWGLALQYNNRMLPKEAIPKSFAELAEPHWKSRVAIADPARSAAGFLFLKAMVSERGWEWVERMMRNDPMLVAVAPGIDQAVAKGERLVATSVSSFTSEIMKAGAPIALASPDLLFTSPLTISVIKEAPNPEGAELLAEYLLTKEAGDLYAKHGWYSPRADVKPPFGFPPVGQLKIRYSDVPQSMSRQEYLDKFNAIAQAARK
ncbi:ABC transporter substrate-binding protein [Azospirillum canadense]|uniref:ABC transporter substrate-binding protein n=1 Tax=Azospirillum canadense TaxID=403962 RepID=UPI002226B3B2|nr:extracellular solute-binding protein [Azospirillum canadense]MCW2240508.1 iron(III) transport system substrate-binding protein [Azospirillum canadense]